MSLENVAAAARKRSKELLDRSPEDVAAKALEELESKVKKGEWDPDEFSPTEEHAQETADERPKRV